LFLNLVHTDSESLCGLAYSHKDMCSQPHRNPRRISCSEL